MKKLLKKIIAPTVGLALGVGIALTVRPMAHRIGYEIGFVHGGLDRGYNRHEIETLVRKSCDKIPKGKHLVYYGCIADTIVLRPVREIAYWRYEK